MPKRVGFLYEKMANKELIEKAIIFASKNKKNKKRIINKILFNIDYYVEDIYKMIVNKTFVPSEPKRFERYDVSSKKIRIVETVPFYPDTVIQHLILLVIEPHILKSMYYHCYASVPKKGATRMRKYIKRKLREDRKGTKYCAELDIKKYYQSISVDKLKAALERKFKDKDLLKLIYDILDTCSNGIAIGYVINHWMANYYLQPLDYFITSKKVVTGYCRYMDNLTIFSGNKRKLHKVVKEIQEFIDVNLGLKLKENWQIFPTSKRPVNAGGYRFYNKYILMRQGNFLRFTRLSNKVYKKQSQKRPVCFKQASSLLTRAGQLKFYNNLNIRTKYLDRIERKPLRKVIKDENKKGKKDKQ